MSEKDIGVDVFFGSPDRPQPNWRDGDSDDNIDDNDDPKPIGRRLLREMLGLGKPKFPPPSPRKGGRDRNRPSRFVAAGSAQDCGHERSGGHFTQGNTCSTRGNRPEDSGNVRRVKPGAARPSPSLGSRGA